ncbi:hypothetical protein D3C71_1924000 [compost metagenome]
MLIDGKVHPEARVTGQDVPSIAMGMQSQLRAFPQVQERALAYRIDVDHCRVSAPIHDDIVVAHHHVRINMRDIERVHDLFAGFLFMILDSGHDRFNPLSQ